MVISLHISNSHYSQCLDYVDITKSIRHDTIRYNSSSLRPFFSGIGITYCVCLTLLLLQLGSTIIKNGFVLMGCIAMPLLLVKSLFIVVVGIGMAVTASQYCPSLTNFISIIVSVNIIEWLFWPCALCGLIYTEEGPI